VLTDLICLDWCIEHHGAVSSLVKCQDMVEQINLLIYYILFPQKSGLTQQVLESTISVQDAEAQVLDFIVKHVPNSGIAQLAGNSVHADKRFLEKEMPKVVEHLHYRIVGKWAWQ